MDDQEQLLQGLISNSFDRVQIKYYLNAFWAKFEDDASSSHLKCLLQLLVIENLKRKADPSKLAWYNALERETSDFLSFYNLSKSEKKL